jgi:hypothetical protein
MTTQNNTKKELTVVTGEVTGEPLLSDELKKKRIKVATPVSPPRELMMPTLDHRSI